MARTGEKENKVANQQHTAEEQQSFATGQQAVHSFTAGENALERGGQIGANPYLNPQYLASVNRLQAGALDSQNNSAKAELEARSRRSGGLNSTATTGAIRDIALQKMRLGDQLSSERTAGDFNKNLGWQQQLLQNRLAPAGVENSYYGTATSGREGSLKNLTDLGIAAYGPWMAAIQSAGQAASAAAGGAGGGGSKGCWIAEAIYGPTAWETTLLRSWLNDEFTTRWYGKLIMRAYLRFGERIAQSVKQSRLVRALFAPWFDLALNRAMAERGIV